MSRRPDPGTRGRRAWMPALALLLACGGAGCAQAWHVKSPGDPAVTSEGKRVRVRTVADSVHVLEAVRVEGDSLIGFGPDHRGRWRRVAIPVGSIRKLQVREADLLRSLLFGGGAVVGAAMQW